MRSHAFCFITSFLIVSAVAQGSSVPANRFEATPEVRKLVENQLQKDIEALNKNDTEYMKSSQAPEIVLIGTRSEEFTVGQQKTSAEMSSWSQKFEILQPVIVRREISQKGDMVWVASVLNSRVKNRKTGKITEYRGLRYTVVYLLEDGKLKAVQEHTSSPDDVRP